MELRLTREIVANSNPNAVTRMGIGALLCDWLALYAQHEADAKALAEKDARLAKLRRYALALEPYAREVNYLLDKDLRDAEKNLDAQDSAEMDKEHESAKRPPATGEGR